VEGTRIVLVRHGESRAQEREVVGGHAGCTGLSDLGRRQVEALRDRLTRTGELNGAAALYASVMPRAVETASIIAEAVGIADIAQECDFCEHHPGEGDGLAWDEYARLYPKPTTWDPELRRNPTAETWTEMQVRVVRALDTVVERHAGETVIVACHGGVIVHSMIRWLGLEPEIGGARAAGLSPENASLTEWSFTSGELGPLRLVRFNDYADYAHLAGST
jgi:broad specificity phosphatase PhoE